MTGVEMSASRTYPIDVERAFDIVLPMPLPDLFSRGHGPLPPIRATRQDGAWERPGQQRTILLKGPGTMRETLDEVHRPSQFSYTISDVTGPMALLVQGVEGAWAFEAVGAGVRITWSWRVMPKGVVGRAAMPVFTRFWHGYAAKALATLEPHLAAQA